MKNLKFKTLIYLLIITTTIAKTYGQTEPLKLENFRSGKLANGMTYFIKNLKKPQTKTYLNLFVKAGRQQEEPGQQNFAHAIEHLVFKPTKNFPKGIEDYGLLEPLSMDAKDISASTGYRKTRYFFNVPTNNPQAVKMGLQWFNDIINNGLQITKENLNQERGALIQELLYSTGGEPDYFFTESNLNAKLFPCRRSSDNFFEHNRTFTATELAKFYKDWYRPGLMAVAIVGNINDMQAVEQQVQQMFGDIPAHHKPKAKIDCDSLYFASPSQFAIINSGHQGEEVEYRMYYRQPEIAKNISTQEGYKQYLAAQLFFKGLGKRLRRFLGEKQGVRNFYKYKGAPLTFMLSITSDKKGKKIMNKVFQIIHQLKEYGFLPEEWEDLKTEFLSNRLQEKERPQYWYLNLENYFIHEQALFGKNGEGFEQWVKELELKEFNAWSKNYLERIPDDIGIIAPTGHKAMNYSKKQLYRWMEEGWQQKIEPYRLPKKITIMTEEQVNSLPLSQIITDQVSNIGTREITLENGLKVVLKAYEPTKGVYNNRIMLHAFSNTGAACFPKEDYYSALNVAGIIKHASTAGLSPKQREIFMEQTGIKGFSPYIDFKESGVQGRTRPESLEKMFQMLYLYMTSAKFSQETFEDWKKTVSKNYENNAANYISRDFSNAIRSFEKDSTHPPAFGYRYMAGSKAYEGVAYTQYQRAHSIYKQIFGNSKDFTVMLSGNFKIDTVLPMIQRYLGNLPSKAESLTCPPQKHLVDGLPKGPIFYSVPVTNYSGENVQYALKYIKSIDNVFSWKEDLKVELLGELTNLMVSRLRYKKGFSVYNFRASGSYNPDQKYHQILFDISCQPEEFEAIQKECFKITNELKEGKINEKYFRQAVNNVKARYNIQRLKLHRNMQKLLYEYYRYDLPWIDLEKYKNYLNTIQIEDMKQMSQKYFRPVQRYEYVMNDKNL